MFDIGGGELILILMAVLLFFGPKKIPELAKSVGNAVRHVRKAQQEFSRQIHTMSEEAEYMASSVTEEVSSISKEVSSIHSTQENVGFEHHNNLDSGREQEEISQEPLPLPTIRPVEGSIAKKAFSFPSNEKTEAGISQNGISTNDSTEPQNNKEQ